MRARRFVNNTGMALVDVVFPRRCAGCGHRGDWVCAECFTTTEWIGDPACQRCGQPAGARCRCAELPDALDMTRSAVWYDGWIRSAVQGFKYEGERARAGHLAELLSPIVATAAVGAVLVPVPLHPQRETQRGFNQAREIALRCGDMTVDDVLVRQIATSRQVGLAAAERLINVRGAFNLADGVMATGRRFALIDDVMTTGATLSECASVLKAHGASWVGAFTVARER